MINIWLGVLCLEWRHTIESLLLSECIIDNTPQESAQFQLLSIVDNSSLLQEKEHSADVFICDAEFLQQKGKAFIPAFDKMYPETALIFLLPAQTTLSGYLDQQDIVYDILYENELEQRILLRSITYTLQRKTAQMMLAQKSHELHCSQQQIHLYKKEIAKLQEVDPLTGLSNRRQFKNMLNKVLQKHHHQEDVLILIMDLHEFKHVNKTIGYIGGDILLKEVALRLKPFFESQFCVCLARLGEDEFAAILKLNKQQSWQSTAETVLEIMKAPFIIYDIVIDVGLNIGMSLASCHGYNGHDLIHYADIAMRYGKKHNKFFALYNADVMAENTRPLSLISEIRRAIELNEFTLYYHPVIHIETSQIMSVEALIRWRHPQFGLLMPDKFVPYIEQSPMIHELTLWVIREAAKAISYFLEQGYYLPISINLSMKNLQNAEFPEEVEDIIKYYQIPPELFILEITETALMIAPETVINVVDRLKRFGFTISIDDFGMGYSSLSYLKDLPVDEVKIDRNFVKNMMQISGDKVIVETIIQLCRGLNFKVVAEGVETAEVYQKLKTLHCDFAQGFYIARPQSLNDFETWLKYSHLWWLQKTKIPQQRLYKK